jgi:hypothetical protein
MGVGDHPPTNQLNKQTRAEVVRGKSIAAEELLTKSKNNEVRFRHRNFARKVLESITFSLKDDKVAVG